MAVKIRLRREGKRKQPFYRVVVADIRSPRDGRFIEDIGYYHPLKEPSDISIDSERAIHWLRNGAQPSQAVANLLRNTGIWEEFKPGEPDPNADRRAKRQAKREQQEAKLAAAAERDAKAAKEAADARAAAAAPAEEEAPGEDADAGAESAESTEDAQADTAEAPAETAADGEASEDNAS